MIVALHFPNSTSYIIGKQLPNYGGKVTNIRKAVEDERIGGLSGWVDSYIVITDNITSFQVPSYQVVVEMQGTT